jgi:RimJ/RimL family protein N-acetyltransferase
MQLVPIEQDGGVDLQGATSAAACADVIGAGVALYARKGFAPPWILYLAVENGVVVGTCGFAAPPSQGKAEIAYFTFPGHEGGGVATRMAQALMDLSAAQARAAGVRFSAHTLPVEGASTAILRKLGFVLQGPVHHPEDGEVWQWVRPAA